MVRVGTIRSAGGPPPSLDAPRSPSAHSSIAPALVTQGAVFIAGGGLWADALSRVVFRGGGQTLYGRSEDESLAVIAVQRPAVIVAGPPLGEAALNAFFAAARTASPSSLFVAAVSRADAALRGRLHAAGANRVIVVPSGGGELAVEVVKAASLSTRSHRRVALAVTAIVFGPSGERFRVVTRDVSEAGVGIDAIPERIKRGPARLEFALPGQPSVLAPAQLVWMSGDGKTWTAGLRFEALSDADRGRLRAFVSAAAR